ncbi:MAG: hypothetical protein ISR20_06905 [Candidatus Poseidonia sp.]|nr:hypothetical protein [Poseidonia sp.]
MDTANAKSFGESDEGIGGLSGWVLPAVAFILLLLVPLGFYVLNKAEDAIEVEKLFSSDDDIAAVVDDATLLE